MQKFATKVMQSTIPVVSSVSGTKIPAEVPPSGQSIRVVGDSAAPVLEGENWKSGVLGIECPLPDGYPPPTPSNCIEIKTYPVVRRAEFDSQNLWVKGFFG